MIHTYIHYELQQKEVKVFVTTLLDLKRKFGMRNKNEKYSRNKNKEYKEIYYILFLLNNQIPHFDFYFQKLYFWI